MNVRKHVAPRRVLVRTSCRRGRCRLSVDDDGTGWTEGSPTDDGRGLGLAHLQERVTALGGSVVWSRSSIGAPGLFTPWQFQLLRGLATGNTNKELVHDMGISEATVKSYLKELFARLDVGSRAGAVAYGIRHGLIR